MARKILIVEDTPESLEMYAMLLENRGYLPLKAEDGETALKLASTEIPDLIILDKMLPGISGSEVCKIIKSDYKLSHIPVIIMTAKNDTPVDVAKDFEVGADDYLKKPFESDILLSHIDKFLKSIDYQKDGVEKLVKNGDLVLDLGAREVRVKNERVLLTRKEFDLLYLLLRKTGQGIDKKDIADIVWGYNFPQIYVTIDNHILNLKRKLGKEVAKRIISLSDGGYEFSES